MGAYLEGYFFAINNKGLLLKVWFPDFFGVALRKADIVAKLFAFAGNVTYTHNVPSIFKSLF